MKEFETFEHEADIGIRGFGKTIEEAFENGAKAMFSVMVDLEKVEAKQKIEVECDAPDKETLFIEWLNKLLSLIDLEGMVFSKFKVKIDGNKLKGEAFGEKLVQEKHKTKIEVKAATYSQMKVYEEKGKWTAQCIVDV